MRHNTNVLLLFLVFFGLCSVNGYKLIDDNLQDEEDPEWNQVIGNLTWDQTISNCKLVKLDQIRSKWTKLNQNESKCCRNNRKIENELRFTVYFKRELEFIKANLRTLRKTLSCKFLITYAMRPFFEIFEITRTIYSNSERSEQFLVTECFFNLRFLISNKIEQL